MSKLHLRCWLLTLRLLANIAHGLFRLRVITGHEREHERVHMEEQDRQLQADTDHLLIRLEQETGAYDAQADH